MNVGIDLGTTYSAVATFDKASGQVVVLKNDEGNVYTPSVVCIDDGEIYIGNEAKNLMAGGNKNAAAFYKSMMGEKGYSLYIDGKEYTPEDLSAIFLRELKKNIEDANGVKIDGAVITVPAYFEERQRQATLSAGKRAGLNVLKIINEPTSAIIAYGLTDGGEKTVMVYDLGGGTFDVTIAKIKGTQVDVLTTNGNHQLGGKDWDLTLVNEITRRFSDDYDVDLTDNPEEYNELQVKCEEAKKKLTSMASATIAINCGGMSGRYEITREFFDEQTEGLLNETVMLIEQCFADIQKDTGRAFGWSNIDEVVLVGGSTRMPQVRDMICRVYGKPPVTKNVNVDTIVASGAAMQAELCTANVLRLGGNAGAPQARGSLGAAPKTNTPYLTISSADIKDVTSHSLGLLSLNKEESDYVNSIILKKNSKVGIAESKRYTIKNKSMDAYVLQGESENPMESTILYRYCISGMNEREQNEVVVSFSYNANGVVEVTANLANGQKLQVDKMEVTESVDALIARLKKEREEMKNRRKDVEVIIMVDVSGSMEDEPILEAQRAIRSFVETVDLRTTTVGILKFAEKSEWVCRFSNNPRDLEKGINLLNVDGKCGWGTEETPLHRYGEDFKSKTAQRVIIVLTDGVWEEDQKEIRAAGKLKDKGITIFGIGVGDADQRFLDAISSKGGRKIDFSQLSATFEELAGTIATEL